MANIVISDRLCQLAMQYTTTAYMYRDYMHLCDVSMQWCVLKKTVTATSRIVLRKNLLCYYYRDHYWMS